MNEECRNCNQPVDYFLHQKVPFKLPNGFSDSDYHTFRPARGPILNPVTLDRIADILHQDAIAVQRGSAIEWRGKESANLLWSLVQYLEDAAELPRLSDKELLERIKKACPEPRSWPLTYELAKRLEERK